MLLETEAPTAVMTLGAVIATLVGLVVWGAKFFARKLFGKEGNGDGGAVGQFIEEFRQLRQSITDLREGVRDLHGDALRDIRSLQATFKKHTEDEGAQHRAMLSLLEQIAQKGESR